MDIPQMRTEAEIYYNGATREFQDLVYQLFIAMARNTNNGVHFREIHNFLRGRTFLTRLLSGDVFRQLDTNGNGTLDSKEFITLYYIIFMRSKCDVCNVLLKGQQIHLTCVTCFTSTNRRSKTYDICGSCYHGRSCYHGGSFKHERRHMVEYNTLILNGAANNISQPHGTCQCARGTRDGGAPSNHVLGVLQATSAVSTTVTAVASAGLCSIL